MNAGVAKTSKVCEVCNLILTGDATWQAHIQGKRHLQAQARHNERFEQTQRSIYVGNLPQGTNDTILFNYFMRYADVTKVIMDKNQGRFAIIEFSSSDSISYVISQKHFLSDRRLMVQRRKLKPDIPTRPMRRDILRAEEARSNEQLCDQVFNQLVMSGNVGEQMEDLVSMLKLSDQETDYRSRFIQELIQVLRRYFSYSEVHVYGSSANGLGQVGCDLDILVSLRPESEEQFQVEDNGNNQRSAKRLFEGAERGYKINPEHLCDLSIKDVTFLLKLILGKVPHCQNILLIPSKRCPIVRFTHVELGISCDVSVKHRLCLYNTNLIRLMAQLDRRALLLFFTIKYWAKVHEIGGGGGARLSSYSVVMLVIFYLQNTVPQILPTVQQLRDMEGQSHKIAGWECSFCNFPGRIPVTKNRQTIDDLLKNFFHFYADFDFTSYAVCPLTGEEVPKTELLPLITSAAEKPLCIQDPFELSHNLTGNVSDKIICILLEAIRRGSVWAKSPGVWASRRDDSNWGVLPLFERFPIPNIQPGPSRNPVAVERASPKPSPQQNAPQIVAAKQPSPLVQKKSTPPSTKKAAPQSGQESQATPKEKSSYWSAQKPVGQAAGPVPPAQVAKSTVSSTTKPDKPSNLPQSPAVQKTTVRTTPAETAVEKPTVTSVLPENSKPADQANENTAVLPSPIRAWPPITTAIIQQPTKRKRKSKTQIPQQLTGETNVYTFVVVAPQSAVEKIVGSSHDSWSSLSVELKDEWCREFFSVLYATFSDALQMPCSELEIKRSAAPNGDSNNTKRLKVDDKNSSPAKGDVSSGEDSNDDKLAASFLCSVYHRTWEKRRYFKQRLVPTTPRKPSLEVEEKISMMVIESIQSTPGKPLFSFKCHVENSNQLNVFKVDMMPTSHSKEFVGVVVDFFKSFVPKAVMKSLEERLL